VDYLNENPHPDFLKIGIVKQGVVRVDHPSNSLNHSKKIETYSSTLKGSGKGINSGKKDSSNDLNLAETN
jgi:hypothetical protein